MVALAADRGRRAGARRAGAAGVRRWRRGAPPALSELERALRRTRREPTPGTTLHVLEQRFAATPAAAGYVRALRESRYRDTPAHPTRAQRRGLRSELGRGSGVLGRVRAWWALPPREDRRLAPRISSMEDVYELYQRGMALLEDAHYHQATSRWPRPAT